MVLRTRDIIHKRIKLLEMLIIRLFVIRGGDRSNLPNFRDHALKIPLVAEVGPARGLAMDIKG